MGFLIQICMLLFFCIHSSSTWEYCKSEIKSKLCADKGGTHIICDSLTTIHETSCQAEHFLAHVPLTRMVKEAFTSWHNYFRNRIARGIAKNFANSKRFPAASRMRELIWDKELSFISHHRTRLVVMGHDTCHSTQRFPHAGQNMDIKVFNHSIPVLEIISMTIREWFDEKNKVDDPEEMPKEFMSEYVFSFVSGAQLCNFLMINDIKTTSIFFFRRGNKLFENNVEHFTIMVNDRVSRLGCAIALGSKCHDKNLVLNKLCYYIACTYDYGNSGLIYETTNNDPASECSRWGVGKSEKYKNLCENFGAIFDYNDIA